MYIILIAISQSAHRPHEFSVHRRIKTNETMTGRTRATENVRRTTGRTRANNTENENEAKETCETPQSTKCLAPEAEVSMLWAQSTKGDTLIEMASSRPGEETESESPAVQLGFRPDDGKTKG
jgi:hypothetical protein